LGVGERLPVGCRYVSRRCSWRASGGVQWAREHGYLWHSANV
jgi:hypothetical protein